FAMMSVLRFKRMPLEHRTHTHLREKRFEIRSESMDDRDEVFRLTRYTDLFDKSLEGLDVLVEKKAYRACGKFIQPRVESLGRLLFAILFSGTSKLCNGMKFVAQTDRIFELCRKIREHLVRIDRRVEVA